MDGLPDPVTLVCSSGDEGEDCLLVQMLLFGGGRAVEVMRRTACGRLVSVMLLGERM